MLSTLARYAAAILIAIAGPLAAWGLTGDHHPLQASDAEEYIAAGPSIQACTTNLTGDRPGCWYLSPPLPGGDLLVPAGTSDPAATSAAALQGSNADLVKAADALVATQVAGAWWYQFPVSFAGGAALQPPWKSASAQGLSLAVLARAYAVNPDPGYLAAIRSAVDAMPISADGWPQEYPDNSYVLNGGLTATLGLWDAWRVSGYSAALDRFNRAVAWLDGNLGRYDRDFVVLYALGPHAEPAGATYLKAAEAELTVLALISGHEQFTAVSNSWDWRRTNPGGFKLLLLSMVFLDHPAALLLGVASLGLALAIAWQTTAGVIRRRDASRVARLVEPELGPG